MNYIFFIWLTAILTSVQNLGQFCVGTITSLAITHVRENHNKASAPWLSNELILACCIGISSAIFYTWIRFNPEQNAYIMFTKRYLLIPLNLVSLSMLLFSQKHRNKDKEKGEKKTWKNILIIASINIILTLPFAKDILKNEHIIIYFAVVILSAVVTALLDRDSDKGNSKSYGIIFSVSSVLLIFFCESRIIGGVYTTSVALLACYKLQDTILRLKILKKTILVIQMTGIYYFSIILPLLVILSPWITPKESDWSSKALWTLTGSRYFSTWSYNLWGSEELGLRSIFNLKGQIPFLDTYTFYDKHLTEYYGETFVNIERLSKYLGNAHSDPIQRLLNLTTGTNKEIALSIVSLLIIIYLWWKILIAFSKFKNKQEEGFKIFCLISNLAIISYITTESLTPWQSMLMFSSQALCLHCFFYNSKSANIGENNDKDRNTRSHSILNPSGPLMLVYPYLILFAIPGMMLITKSR